MSSPSACSAPASFLAKLAPMAAGGWHALGAQMFPGELSLATTNTVYRFKNGVFQGRARKNARTFECPKAMRGLRLIGFLHDEGGLWSLSPRWREGAGTRCVGRAVAEEHRARISGRHRPSGSDRRYPARTRSELGRDRADPRGFASSRAAPLRQGAVSGSQKAGFTHKTHQA